MSQPILEVDVAIIGAGTAGLAARRAALEHTESVVLIEGGRGGTTCARVGCMPSKLLIAAADAARHARHTDQFGVHTGTVEIDGKAVMDRVRSERDRFVGFVDRSVESIPSEQKLSGYARFLDDHTLEVGDRVVRAKRIVIATGSTPRNLPFLRELGDRRVVNDDVFDWGELPQSVVVFGPGVIGLELGQALAALGVRVRMFGVGGFVGPLSDPAIRDYAEAAFNDEFPLHPDGTVQAVRREGDMVAVDFLLDGVPTTEHFDYVLEATGREVNVAGLGLENTSLVMNGRAPRVSPATGQTSVPHIFVAGDVSNFRPILHEAADEGRIAGANAGRFPDVRPEARRAPLSVVFTHPQIAMVGARFSDLDDPIVGEVSFEDQGRSRVMGVNRGLLHVYADRKTGHLLGAEMIGPDAEHLGHLMSWVLQLGLTVPQILELPFYHPVVEEGLRTALRDAASQLAEQRDHSETRASAAV